MNFLLTLFILIFAFQISFGQENLKAKKIDEFSNRCDEDVMARFGNLITIRNVEPNNRGVIVFYGNEIDEGKNLSLIDWYKFYSRMGGLDVQIIRGANQQKGKTEFWAVPVGAELPKPENEFVAPVFDKRTRFDLADAFIEPGVSDDLQTSHSELGCQLQPNLKEFAKILLDNQNLQGLVIVDNRNKNLGYSVAQIIVDKLTANYKVPRNRFRLNFQSKSEFGNAELLFIPKKSGN